MKKLICVFLFSPLIALSQTNPIIITSNDFTVDSTYLKVVTDSELETTLGAFPLKKVKEINFIDGYHERMTNVYSLLERNGIIVKHEKMNYNPETWGKWSPPTYVDGYINEIAIKDINAEYSRIVGTEVFLSQKVIIQIEFGQRKSLFTSTLIKDKNGKAIKFYSMIGALNFMHRNGYEFVTAYALTINDQNVYHYLLRKMSN